MVQYFKTTWQPIKGYYGGHDYIRVVSDENSDKTLTIEIMHPTSHWLDLQSYDERPYIFKRRSGRKRPRLALGAMVNIDSPGRLLNSHELTEIIEAQLIMEIL